jgi:hypothetical protein
MRNMSRLSHSMVYLCFTPCCLETACLGVCLVFLSDHPLTSQSSSCRASWFLPASAVGNKVWKVLSQNCWFTAYVVTPRWFVNWFLAMSVPERLLDLDLAVRFGLYKYASHSVLRSTPPIVKHFDETSISPTCARGKFGCQLLYGPTDEREMNLYRFYGVLIVLGAVASYPRIEMITSKVGFPIRTCPCCPGRDNTVYCLLPTRNAPPCRHF